MVNHTLVAGNLAQGGAGRLGSSGGDGWGGGVFNDADSTLKLSDSILIFNQAIGGAGGTGGTGGTGLGGGLYNGGDASRGGGASLNKSAIAFNMAKGGAAGSGGSAGIGEGGGVYNNLAQGADISIDLLTVIFANQPDNCFGC
jgi:hypothetical protein